MNATAQVPIAELKRQAVTNRVLAAAGRLVMSVGLDVTMDQIAEASGVSRSSLFRLFNNRETLLAAALEAGMAGYRKILPTYDGDLEAWLRAICIANHRMMSVVDTGFFELTTRSDIPDGLAEMEQVRKGKHRINMAWVADTLWSAAGETGQAPPTLALTVSTMLSPFLSAAVRIDIGQTWEVAAGLAYDTILAAAIQQSPALRARWSVAVRK